MNNFVVESCQTFHIIRDNNKKKTKKEEAK